MPKTVMVIDDDDAILRLTGIGQQFDAIYSIEQLQFRPKPAISGFLRILQREQLMGKRDLQPTDRSIDVRISRLRRKLEPDPQNPALIKTVYGAGYLFLATVNWR